MQYLNSIWCFFSSNSALFISACGPSCCCCCCFCCFLPLSSYSLLTEWNIFFCFHFFPLSHIETLIIMFFVLHDRYLVLHIIEYIENNMKMKLKINIDTLVKDVFYVEQTQRSKMQSGFFQLKGKCTQRRRTTTKVFFI